MKQLPIWDLWLALEWKQLDAHQKKEIFGVPCPAPPGATMLRFHWDYIIKPCGTRKARMCCNGSKRAALELRVAQTYASCIDQPCMRLFFALSAAMGFVVMGADCTVRTPMPLPKRHTPGLTTPTPTGIALAIEKKLTARWYYHCPRPCRDIPKPVLCFVGWEQHINNILNDLNTVDTTHERSIYRGKIDGKVVHLCRQVDDLAVACSDPSVAQGLINSIGEIVALKSQETFNSFNGINIDQRHEYVKVSCQSYLVHLLKAHDWDKSSPTEKSDFKPIEPLAASTAEELSTSVEQPKTVLNTEPFRKK
jgi:hypothetical protein